MRAAPSLVLSVGLISSAFAEEEPNGKPFAPQDAGFEVRFPGEPKFRETPRGDFVLHAAGIPRTAVDGLGFTCHWLLGQKPKSEQETAAYLEGQALGAVAGSKGKVLENKEISSGGFPGRQYIIEVHEQQTVLTRAYVAGQREIFLAVMGKDRAAVTSAEAIRFLDSLSIRK